MGIQRRLRSYGTPDWDGKIILSDWDRPRRRARLCRLPRRKIEGQADRFYQYSTLQQKMVHELNMPYDSTSETLGRLQMRREELYEADETGQLAKHAEAQKALFLDFENSRLELLKKWLLEVPCGS